MELAQALDVMANFRKKRKDYEEGRSDHPPVFFEEDFAAVAVILESLSA